MKLTDGVKNKIYTVKKINLPVKILKHLEALGMTPGAEIIVLNKKSSALIAGFRGTRFALGRQIAENIEITEIIKGGV
ncbi:MAG: FeoA domain-containing protein [Oscillospiraceae bacterium]|nr:FeoA domain-containing protein [Oscillospiraceae bacterium]